MFDSIRVVSVRQSMLKRIHELLEEADVVCHYNGTKFDIPTLNNEFFLYGLGQPSPFQQIDLLKVTRKNFRFPSNKLDYVAQQLKLGRKTKHMGMEMWRDCMEMCPKAWRVMKRYNIQDVKLLESYYNKVLPLIHNHPNWGLFKDAERPTCRNCGSTSVIKKGIERTNTMTYQRYKCKSCGTHIRGRKALEPAKAGLTV